jgi:hydroxyacylglutathione hydrolase
MKIYFHLNIEGFSNCYVIVNEATKKALIIDPGKITPDIISQIEDGGYQLTAVLITHNHANHVRGLSTLRKIYKLTVYAADSEVAGNDTAVIKGDGTLKIGGLNIGYFAIPGHTSDSMVYKIGRVLFTGDVISAGKTGETTTTYSLRTLHTGILTKILSQQENTVIMPGHGPPTSVAAEKLYNPDLNVIPAKRN